MRLVLQRVSRARVEVAGERVGAVGRGLLVLVGIDREDDATVVEAATEKILCLRLFDDPAGRFDLDLAAAGGAVLLVSQFTLLADVGRGRRPSFDRAAPAREAEPLVAALAAALRRRGARVEVGRFGARMEVELVNDGPVTLVIDLARHAG